VPASEMVADSVAPKPLTGLTEGLGGLHGEASGRVGAHYCSRWRSGMPTRWLMPFSAGWVVRMPAVFQ
jgi:hypothetical protein